MLLLLITVYGSRETAPEVWFPLEMRSIVRDLGARASG
jgi:hypothetical protein